MPVARFVLLQCVALLTNLSIVALAVFAGTIMTVWHVRTYPNAVHYALIDLFVATGVLLSILINRWMLKRALNPLDRPIRTLLVDDHVVICMGPYYAARQVTELPSTDPASGFRAPRRSGTA